MPALDSAAVPATTSPTAALDPHGFDPAAFDWKPVPRRPRKDGWTPEVQQQFMAALARTGVVERACEAVGRSVKSAYDLRHSPGGEGFARAWDAVLARAADRLLDVTFELAMVGEEVPIFDRDGVRVGTKYKPNTRMMMFLLRAYRPDRFRHAHRDGRAPDESLPPPMPALPQVVATLAPVTPDAPHRTAGPEHESRIVADARWQANQPEPAEVIDPWRVQTVPVDHPKVTALARRNRRRRQERENRAGQRYGDADDDRDSA